MATQRERSDLIAQVLEVAASIRNVSDSPRTVRQQFRADYADLHTDLRSRSVELCVFDGRTYHQEQDAIHNHLNALENIVSALVDKPDEAVADLESVRNSIEEAILDMPVDEELLHDLDSGNAEARHDDPVYLVAKGEKMVLAFKEVELAVSNLLVEVKSVKDWTAIADTEEDLRKVVAHMEACVVMLRHGVIHLGLASDTVTLVEQLKHVGVFRIHALRLNNSE